MTLNKIFKIIEQKYDWADTFVLLHGSKKKNKKLGRRYARKRMKQDRFYNGFYEFIEEQRKK